MPCFSTKCITTKTKHQTGYKSISIKTLMPETAKYISWKRVNLSKAKTFWQTGFVSSTIKLSTTGLIYHLRRSKTYQKTIPVKPLICKYKPMNPNQLFKYKAEVKPKPRGSINYFISGICGGLLAY